MRPERPTRQRKDGRLGWVAAVLTVSLGLSALLWSRAEAGFLSGHEGLSAGFLSLVCWLLVVGGIAGTALASCGSRFGWLLLLGLQPPWIAYALCTDQNGLIVGCLAYGAAQLNGFLKSARVNAG